MSKHLKVLRDAGLVESTADAQRRVYRLRAEPLREVTDRVRIELRAEGDGTVLVLSDTFAELGKAARDAAGWHECVTHLLADLAGAEPPGWGETWKAVHLHYVERFGPEASTEGPPGS